MARLERALAEYGVGGVKTTLPFFRWLLQRPEFVSGNVDTGFLDAILADGERAGFSDTPEDVEERVVLATALRAYLRTEMPVNGAVENAVTGWRRAARLEALG